jgi:hypothetical protein
VRPALPFNIFLFREFKIGLVYEGSGLKRMSDPLSLKIPVGLSVKFRVDEIEKSSRGGIAALLIPVS